MSDKHTVLIIWVLRVEGSLPLAYWDPTPTLRLALALSPCVSVTQLSSLPDWQCIWRRDKICPDRCPGDALEHTDGQRDEYNLEA